MTPTPVIPVPAPLWRRLAAAGYDGLLLVALWLVVTMADTTVRILAHVPPSVPVLQAALLLSALGFFGWSWTHGGQTLGMRAWRLRVRRTDGRPLGWPTAVARYGFAWLAWLPLGLGVLWAAFDPQRRALHERLSGTELIFEATDPSASSRGAP